MPDRDPTNFVDAAYTAIDAAVIDAYNRGNQAERRRVRHAITGVLMEHVVDDEAPAWKAVQDFATAVLAVVPAEVADA